MRKKILFSICICICFSLYGQQAGKDESKLLGKWIYEGFTFSGTFYPSNDWKKNYFFFHEDYSFENENSYILNQQTIRDIKKGRWKLSGNNDYISIYSDEERYISNQKVVVYDRDFPLHFFNNNYVEVLVTEDGIEKVKRYRKEGVTISFEGNYLQHQEDLKKPRENYSDQYFVINHLQKGKNNQKEFGLSRFDIRITERYPYPSLQKRLTDFSGTILNFDAGSITFSIERELVKENYTNGNKKRSFQYYKEQEIKKIPVESIQSFYNTPTLNAYRITAGTTILSAVTTFIIAPIVSYQFKSGQFNKKTYFSVAGAGLAGMAVSIPVTILLRKNALNFKSSTPDNRSISLKKQLI